MFEKKRIRKKGRGKQNKAAGAAVAAAATARNPDRKCSFSKEVRSTRNA